MVNDKIAVLGSGITAKSVLAFAKRMHIEVVDVHDASLIITSPGINPETFPKTKTPIISDIEWAYRWFQNAKNPPTLIGVTGTNGKSTVTALISHVCDIPYAGNIGVPLLDYVGLEDEFPCIVVELSSYQLETCVDFRTDIAVLLNISPDHLARHKTMDRYIHEKMKCFVNQTEDDHLLYNEDDDVVVSMTHCAKSKKSSFSKNAVTDRFGLVKTLIGDHNRLNAAIALKVAALLELDEDTSFRSLHLFKPLKHRLEFVCDYNGLKIFNDSKATNPESTILGIKSFTETISLICCGDDKGLDLSELVTCIGKNVSELILFGGIADRLQGLMLQRFPNFLVTKVKDMQEAIAYGIQSGSNEHVLLFSPASSSFDCFNGFEDRGNQFINGVTSYVEAALA